MNKQDQCALRIREVSKYRQFIYGVSALWILFYHMNTKVPAHGVLRLLRLVQETGTCGVEVFLLLTGFGLNNALNKNADIKRFYQRRLVRVLLPALVVVFVCDLAACSHLFGYELNLRFFLTWPWSGGLWYVSYILIMYLIYPLLHRVIRPDNIKHWIGVFFAVFIMAFSLEFLPVHLPAELLRAATRMPVFLLACIIAPAVEKDIIIPRFVLPCTFLFGVAGVIAWKIMMRKGYIYSMRMAAFVFLGIAVIILLTMLARNMTEKTRGGGEDFSILPLLRKHITGDLSCV